MNFNADAFNIFTVNQTCHNVMLYTNCQSCSILILALNLWIDTLIYQQSISLADFSNTNNTWLIVKSSLYTANHDTGFGECHFTCTAISRFYQLRDSEQFKILKVFKLTFCTKGSYHRLSTLLNDILIKYTTCQDNLLSAQFHKSCKVNCTAHKHTTYTIYKGL